MRQSRGKVGEASLVVAQLSDLRTLVELIAQYYKFDGIRFERSIVRKAVRALLSDPSIGRAWIIRAGKEDIGYCILTFGYDIEFGGRVATLTDLYIDKQNRRTGLGTRIIQDIETSCRKMSVRAIELQVERANSQAQRFYRSLGFKSHDRIPHSKLL